MFRHISTLVPILALIFAAPAAAQEELNDDRKIERHKEITQTLTEAVYKRLNSIHEDLGDGEFDKAIKELGKLEKIPLKTYEEALVLQTFGFAYVQQGKHQQALDYFERCLAKDSLPGAAAQGMFYSLAGLYATEGQYLKAIETIRRWFRYEEDPIADAYMIIASSFTELQRYDDALPYVRKAIEKSDEPNENWYMLELAIYFEKERYRDAAGLLRKMVAFWPDDARYWDMLASAYLELKDDKNALDTMMVEYTRGLVDTEQKLLAVVQLNMVLDIPFTAGAILEESIAAGSVEASKDNLEILLQAWLSAKEYARAVRTIDRLGPLAEDGSYFMQKAGIHNERGEWEEVTKAARQALGKGLDDPVTAHMLAGMAYTELKDFNAALAEFRKARAAGDDKQRKNATAWIDFVDGKIAVRSAALN